jgi:hypothetical protein
VHAAIAINTGACAGEIEIRNRFDIVERLLHFIGQCQAGFIEMLQECPFEIGPRIRQMAQIFVLRIVVAAVVPQRRFSSQQRTQNVHHELSFQQRMRKLIAIREQAFVAGV